MTEQYGQRNINNPEGSRNQSNSVADPDFTLTASDTGKLLILDTTLGGAGTATLPRASDAGAGAEITIIAPGAAVGPLTVAADVAVADVLVSPLGAPSNPIIVTDGNLIVRSNGGNRWYVVGGIG